MNNLILDLGALLVASIVGAGATTTISQFTSIYVVKSAYAFPCKGNIVSSVYTAPIFYEQEYEIHKVVYRE